MKPLRTRQLDAEQSLGKWLADANEADERGDKTMAEKLYAKAQYWRDRMNLLCGDGDRPAPGR